MIKLIESRQAQKDLDTAPKEIIRSYEVWSRLIETSGLTALKKFPGYRDESLKGKWQGFRSSRLNLKWRVIYQIDHSDQIQIVNIARVTAHDYRRK